MVVASSDLAGSRNFSMTARDSAPVFRRIAPRGEAELRALVERLVERIDRALERRGVLV